MEKKAETTAESFFDSNVHIGTRTLYIGTEESIDHTTAEYFLKGMAILESLSDKDITIIMNGIGGEYYNSMAIYDRIKSSSCKTIIKCYGQAMSGNSLILQAADVRMLSPHCKIMIHYGTFGHEDNSRSFKNWAEEAERLNKEMEKVYFERMKQKNPQFKLSELRKMLSFDTILNAQESILLGLADKIIK